TAAFTFSAAAVYSAARLLNTPASNFVTACRAEDDIEIYGESESRPLYTATLPVAPERALAIGRSELRLEPETPAVPVTEVLPAAVSAPESIEVASMPFLWAAALYGACPHRGIEANLLPPERRRGSSRLRLVPTFALGIALAVLLVLLALQSSQADKRYLGVLQHEVSRFEPVARRSEALDRAITSARAHSESLDSFRWRTRLDMDALAETTKLIPPPGWLTHLDMDRNTVTVAGEMDGAAGLLKTFDSSPQFERTEFTMPISRTGSSDLFRIRTNRQTPGAATPSAPPQTQGATK
ncbi:MAG TPA: PilN domain-containing protein, partial [Bryobacteraceae bacterium]|nr:PilN domain-containing protein [Bryobacteraceae bacterium]